jgi:sugar/nucleoside kinase (ribokinase family)
MTDPVQVKPAQGTAYDAVSLGEVMLRLDPGEGRVRTARTFRVWEGGGEYNVARGLRRGFGMRTAVVTALADNDIGRLLEDLMLQGGVDLLGPRRRCRARSRRSARDRPRRENPSLGSRCARLVDSQPRRFPSHLRRPRPGISAAR